MSVSASTVVARSRALPLRREWLVLLSVLALGMVYDAAILFRYPFAVGVDGYYYILQVNELQTHGRLFFSTATPLILYLLTGVSHLTGDPILAVKITSITLHAALCGGVCGIILNLTRSLWVSVLGATLAAISAPHLYMVAEYVNQLGAFTFLVWGVWCALRAWEEARGRKKWLLLSLSCLLAACFSHVSALIVLLALAAALVLSYILTRPRSSGRGYRLEAWLTVFVLWLAPMILAVQRLTPLPEGAEGEVLATPRLPLSRAAATEQIILMFACPAVLIIISTRQPGMRDSRRASLFFGAVALLGLLVTVNPFFNNRLGTGLTWRLSVLAYLGVALLIPYLVWLALSWRQSIAVLTVAVTIPLLLWGSYSRRPLGTESRHLSRRAELLQHLPRLRGQLGPRPIVISPHGEQFVITWALGVASQQTWPEENTYETVYWLLHNVEPQLMTPSMSVIAPDVGGGSIVLAKDDDVQQNLIKPSDEHRRLIMRNKHLLDHIGPRHKNK